MLEWKKTFECCNPKCKHQFQVVADVERDNIIEMPVREARSNNLTVQVERKLFFVCVSAFTRRATPQTVCPSGPKKAACKSASFAYVEGSRECIDYQEIKIQEQVQSLTVGSIPRSIVVVLENDLVRSLTTRHCARCSLPHIVSRVHPDLCRCTSRMNGILCSVHWVSRGPVCE